MAKLTFQLKGLQILGLIVLWAAASAGLFLLGGLVGYRNVVQPDIEAPRDEANESTRETEPGVGDGGDSGDSSRSRDRADAGGIGDRADIAAVADVRDPGPEETLDFIYRRRTQAPSTPFGREIYNAASKQRVNPALVAAIVWIESEFDPRAVSRKGAVGLMQVMPKTAKRFGYDAATLTDPVSNLAAGSEYLHWLAQRYSGNLALILGGYNAGEGAVDRYGGLPPYPETRRYVRQVLAAFRSLDGDLNASARLK